MLDQPYDPIRSGTVHVQRSNPSGPLLAAWLQDALGVPVEVATSRGPGITGVRLHTTRGDLSVLRPDGRVATIYRPGVPDREAALPRRTREELVAEELRRLDPDEIFGETLAALPRVGSTPQRRAPASKAPTKRRTATKAAPARRTRRSAT